MVVLISLFIFTGSGSCTLPTCISSDSRQHAGGRPTFTTTQAVHLVIRINKTGCVCSHLTTVLQVNNLTIVSENDCFHRCVSPVLNQSRSRRHVWVEGCICCYFLNEQGFLCDVQVSFLLKTWQTFLNSNCIWNAKGIRFVRLDIYSC